MYTIKTLNAISPVGLAKLNKNLFDVSVDARLQGSGKFPSKKFFSRNLCFIPCRTNQRCGTESMTTVYADSTLAAQIAAFLF